MKEFSIIMDKEFRLGLRADYRNKRNTGYLVQAMNAKPTRFGLVTVELLSMPLTSVTVNFPFPHLLRGQYKTLLCDDDTIYEVNETTWAATALTTYDAYNTDNIKAITANGIWHMVDFPNFYMLFNGTSTVFYSRGLSKMTTKADAALILNDPTISTGCAFRGRAILGGFTSEGFWNSAWTQYWADHLDTLMPSDITMRQHIQSNMVWWSSVGGGDVIPLFYPDMAATGFIDTASGDTHSNTRPLFLEYWNRNESGFGVMPFQGSVLVIKPLHKSVIVYGTDGIAVMNPHSTPATTFGIDGILGIGIPSRNAVGGDLDNHVFADVNGNIWSLGADLRPKRLGYKEFFKNMVNSDFMISINPDEDDVYICSQGKSYVMTNYGLGQATQVVTSIISTPSGIKAIGTLSGEYVFYPVTDWFDMGIAALKTVTSLEIGGVVPYGNMQIAVEFISTLDAKTYMSDWVPVSPDAFARPKATGLAFRVHLKCNPATQVNIDYITIRWQVVDKRTIRGAYVGATSARADIQALERGSTAFDSE